MPTGIKMNSKFFSRSGIEADIKLKPTLLKTITVKQSTKKSYSFHPDDEMS